MEVACVWWMAMQLFTCFRYLCIICHFIYSILCFVCGLQYAFVSFAVDYTCIDTQGQSLTNQCLENKRFIFCFADLAKYLLFFFQRFMSGPAVFHRAFFKYCLWMGPCVWAELQEQGNHVCLHVWCDAWLVYISLFGLDVFLMIFFQELLSLASWASIALWWSCSHDI